MLSQNTAVGITIKTHNLIKLTLNLIYTNNQIMIFKLLNLKNMYFFYILILIILQICSITCNQISHESTW